MNPIPILFLAACTAGEPAAPGPAGSNGDPGATTVTVPEDVPWVMETEELEPVDLAAVLETAQTGIDLAREITPDPVLAVYRDLAAGADASCPALYEEDVVYWLDNCTASSGTRFDGFGLDDEVYYSDAYSSSTVAATGGAGRIEDASGTYLELDGYAEVIDTFAEGILSSTLLLFGEFRTNHALADGTWLDRGLRPNLYVTLYDIYGLEFAFAVVGAIDGLPGDHPAVAFDDAIIIDPGFGYGGCLEEPTGVVSVRLASGEWVDVVFDPVWDEASETVVFEDGTCDGCGQAWHRDEPLGEACLDFSGW